MAGYTRQSSADIIPTAVVRSAPVNAEFNTLRDAFTHDTAGTTGHKHDGSSSEGSYVPLIADVDGLNKVVIDTSNNRISFYTEVGAAAVEQVRFEDGVIYPVTTNDIDLGTGSLQFKNAYFDGIVQTDTLTVDIDATVAGTLGVTGLSTLPTVDINGGAIDGTIIGATTPAASNFTTLGTSGQAALTSVNIDGGTIDGTAVGVTTPASGVFTTLSATTGITGGLTGNVTGNLTGNVTGAVTGGVTGDLTGNVTAATGSSTFNNVTINGSLDMNSGTSATITNLATPILTSDAATKGYVDTEVSNLVDAAPGTLDTLNELAAALGDDPAFATTVTNSIAAKLPLAGGTMSGAIAMGTSKITGMGDPTANQDAATKIYVDTADALRVTKTGDTMSGDLAMGSNKVTGLAAPTLGGDATNKDYVDGLLGPAIAAADSAAAALVSETNAATSESNAATSESNAAASYDAFDDRYLGSKASAPTLDNDGNALLTGALYWNSTSSALFIWTGSAWNAAAFDTAGALVAINNLSDLTNAVTARTNLGLGTVATTDSTAYATAAQGTTADAALPKAGGTMTGNITMPALGTVDGRDLSVDGAKLDGIEAGADVTDAANVEPLVDTHLNTGTASASEYLSWTGSDYDWVAISGYADADVDTHLNTGTASSGEVLSWNGSDYDWAAYVSDATFDTYITSDALSGTTPSVDVGARDTYTLTTSGNTTFTFTGVPSSGQVGTFSLIITAGGTHTLTWPASVDWAGGTAPDAPASGEKDIYTFMTVDGGTIWYGFLAGDAMA